MKRLVYKPGILLLTSLFLISFTISAQELKKEFHKEYTAKPETKLGINNRYGNVIVHTSASDQIVINVKVTLRFPNSERAERLLSYIDVRFSESDNLISVKTVIDDKFNFSGWGGDARRFSIDYNVSMPEKTDLALTNRYGNTELDDLAGCVTLDIKYGNLTASTLARGNEKPLNSINLAYGKGTIEEVGWLDATIRYSGNFNVKKSQAILLDSRYSTVQIGSASSVVAETKYDKLRIDFVNNLVLDAGYTDVKIGSLSKKLVLNGGYGSFNIDGIPANFESLEVQSKYMGINLGIDRSAEFNLEAKVSYGGLKFDEANFNHKRHIVQNNSTETTGTVGRSQSPSSTVKISASYGTVRLN